MRKRIVWTMVLVVFMVILTGLSAWAVPNCINYQGKLTDSEGNALDEICDMIFRLYDTATRDTLLWTENQASVTVSGGVYNVQLGSVTSFPTDLFDDDSLFLEVDIYNTGTSAYETLSPLQQLTSTAFAMRSGNADALQGMGSIEFIHTDQKAGGDLGGTYPSPMVTGLRGRSISSVLPFSGQVLKYNGSAWAPAKDANSGGDITEVTAGSGLSGGASSGAATLYIPTGGVMSAHIHDGTITATDIADNSVTAAKINSSGLNADTLDGHDSGFFLPSSEDWGRSGISSTLYEGTTPLIDKYVNESGDSMNGTTSGTILSVENSGTGNAIAAAASEENARCIYGNATSTGDAQNYGGYFESAGRYGAGILGQATHSYGGKGIYGEAMGDAGIGVYALNHGPINAAVMARSDNASGGQAIWGIAEGSSGKAVQGQATNTGDAHNYGGYFSANGKYGVGVYGEATADSIHGFENFGGYFVSAGKYGRGVYGSASDIGGKGVFGEATYTTGIDYGGYFKAAGSDGRGVYAEATGARGFGIYARATGGGKAAYFEGDVDVKGNITREYVEGSSNPAVPLAQLCEFCSINGAIFC